MARPGGSAGMAVADGQRREVVRDASAPEVEGRVGAGPRPHERRRGDALARARRAYRQAVRIDDVQPGGSRGAEVVGARVELYGVRAAPPPAPRGQSG